jgi:xanthine dehydrogenase molybdopterin-binding subunit B
METQTCYAIPDENNGLYVHSSSQGPTDIRAMVMRVTGLPANKVTVSTRRTGGAFGGKLSRSHPIASAVSVAACLTNRPIKAQCSRTADMDMWGKRPEMYITYQVGFDNNGKVLALSVVFYQHGGHTYEVSANRRDGIEDAGRALVERILILFLRSDLSSRRTSVR